MTKFIVVTGGVLSGLGKGVSVASIGNLLKAQGFKIFALKLDPYLNIDPGVMSPNEHGEVYVTADGGETDLDLGHYERFMDVKLTRESNLTSGRIYTNIFEKERNGFYNGKTVQVVPHVINEIIERIEKIEKKHKPDFVLIEIGGTVGDIESMPFIYALSKFANLNPKKVMFAHLSYVPFLTSSKEYKSKPSQVSISTLRSYGINPQILLLRSQGEIDLNIINKIAETSFVHPSHVINVPDIANIYQIPLYFEKQKILEIIYEHFKIKQPIDKEANKPWETFVKKVLSKKDKKVKVLLVGKYMGLEDAYLSIISSLKIAASHQNFELEYKLINADEINEENIEETVKDYDGVMILPGFGARGFESKVNVATYTRENKIPTLGICLGFQAMSVSQARKLGFKDATSQEFAEKNKKQTFVLVPFYDNGDKDKLGGSLRLGNDEIEVEKNSLAEKIYGNQNFFARHRHRFEISKHYIETLQDEEFIFSGYNPKNWNAEICEVKSHPFYIGVQYHPEFSTSVLKSNPLFDEFLKACFKNK
ncbi:CTP synthase [Metamycoplasma subdolum]|uniref:CTP synthase (glutamine hydrolyzing) n=1 Tax=Metamycoplasma subdolum TaxID=92407 RepID=A0A3M0A2X9_9BACT|nr:CTP synthase [Metamycoplasma subdolum]RMA78997.1 CTP synthase [Metamycoplasma subdolum]WPB50520.1 CTP synthase [Metamycoplasma subdolum]